MKCVYLCGMSTRCRRRTLANEVCIPSIYRDMPAEDRQVCTLLLGEAGRLNTQDTTTIGGDMGRGAARHTGYHYKGSCPLRCSTALKGYRHLAVLYYEVVSQVWER